MKTAKTQAEFDKIKKTLSGKEKKLGINTFYEALPFDPKPGFALAQDKFEKSLKSTKTKKFSNLKFGQWGPAIQVEKGYKHQVENFVKGFLTYYELWDGGTGEEHTVFFEWTKFKSGFKLTLHLKPWYNNPYPRLKSNTMLPPGSAGIAGFPVCELKSPIPAPPKAGVDPPPTPPCPPPSKS